MKIPKTFLPEENLESKIKDFLKPETVKKVAKNHVSGKRKIWIYHKNNKELPSGGIYVRIGYPQSKNGHWLDVYSDCHFYAPPSEFNEGSKDTGNVKAFCDNNTMLFKFLRSLKYHNKGMFLWEDDKKVLDLKKRYEDKYGTF